MSADDHKQALLTGFRLGAYRVARVLGVGGFGVTYLCEHTGLAVQVAVKEYLPNEIAVRDGTEVHPKSTGDREGFEWGLSRFLAEARTLARFEHPNVVRVRDCFEANNTAYIVMDYEEGEPLDALLRRHGTLTEAQLKRVLLPVVNGLRHVHAAGFLHRDIKPANIFVRRSDESPVLLDFGSARQALGRRSKSVTAIASAGYSPPEQYESDGNHGAWTDIYALSALCYRAITGEPPVEVPRRQSQLLRTQMDPLPKLAEVGREGYSPAFLEAVDWGLRLVETERPQSLGEWLPRLERATTLHQRHDSESRQAGSHTSPPGAHQARKWWWVTPWLVACLVLAVWLLPWLATQQDAGQATVSVGKATEQPFTVLVEPADARVRVLNIGSSYRAGMELAAGSYRVGASAPGYETKIETVAHGRVPTVHRMALSRLGQPFTVLVEPADARVRILNIRPPYRAGMVLSPGSYHVEASARGYETATGTVSHGSSPTVYQMTLRKVATGPKIGERFRDCAECPQMVVVPAGSFLMGSPASEEGRRDNEGPVHRVRIAVPFAVGVYEVTVGQFRRFVQATGHSTGDSCWVHEDDFEERSGFGWRDPGFRQDDLHPVLCVNWDDAQAYVRWLSAKTGKRYRLPSESEWEYAARAGTQTVFHTGETISTDQANYDGDYAYGAGRRGVYRDQTVPVGAFGANEWGLHDVHGNVWEWTEDCWNASYAGAPTDGSAWANGDCSRRVLRGGSWYNTPSILRAAIRIRNFTGNRLILFGFRVARTLAS